MDVAYVKFMMCQCLLNRADWGLAIGCMNVVYSVFLFLFWVVELTKVLDDYPVKWLMLYMFNMMFNVITMMRIVKRESISVFYWMCGTGALLVFRIHHLYYVPDGFYLARCTFYVVSNIFIDVYILLSLLVMLYVMWGLHLEPDRMYPKEDMVNNFKYDPEAAAQNEEQLHERLKDKRLEMVRNIQNIQMNEEIEEEEELKSDHEMAELNRKASLKLADIMEEQAHYSPETTPPLKPTAPEEVDCYSLELFPEPTAPSESKLFLD